LRLGQSTIAQSDIKGNDGNTGDEASELLHSQTLKAKMEKLTKTSHLCSGSQLI